MPNWKNTETLPLHAGDNFVTSTDLYGVTDGYVRLAVGIEHIADLAQALDRA
jgi:O-acetylhomoserine/O-acetylserine sulfhydrylase-like pyridoxal-dependent enzyme